MVRHLLVVAACAAAAFVLVGPAAADPTVFAGTWQAIDGDGSLMTFTVTGSGTSVRVTLHDHYATGCVSFFGANGGNAVVQGSATITGATLTYTWDVLRCENGISLASPGGGFVTYDAATNTLTDQDGITWYPIGPPLEPPTTP